MAAGRSKRILVVRNDKLGDFMLAWPALAMLRRSLPDCELHVLVNAYTEGMARLCPAVNEVVLDPGPDGDRAAQRALIKTLRAQRYDVAITLYSTTRIAWALLRAGIVYRLAPATKFAQVLYNHRLTQRRSRSLQPEYVYNEELAQHYLQEIGVQPMRGEAPFLSFNKDDIATLRAAFCARHGIDAKHQLIFLHPGNGGSARNLDAAQYGALAAHLQSQHGHHVVITAGPGEVEHARAISALLSDTPHTVFASTAGLARFAMHIAYADLFIAGSTGPLHIAGALNINTAAFYPRRRSATALRWQTINTPEHRLVFSPP
ncbi:MAG: glycosyltransferase family 9 protein, partial [Chromatiales bacterium]|nr:glycosyltransferase family 9 protein [Chromatiales bacterium]